MVPSHNHTSLWGLRSFTNKQTHSCFLVAYRPSNMQSASLGHICKESSTCCNPEAEVADQTCFLTQPQYIDTRPNSPTTDPWGWAATGVPVSKTLVLLDRDEQGLISVFPVVKMDTLPLGHCHSTNKWKPATIATANELQAK